MFSFLCVCIYARRFYNVFMNQGVVTWCSKYTTYFFSIIHNFQSINIAIISYFTVQSQFGYTIHILMSLQVQSLLVCNLNEMNIYMKNCFKTRKKYLIWKLFVVKHWEFNCNSGNLWSSDFPCLVIKKENKHTYRKKSGDGVY